MTGKDRVFNIIKHVLIGLALFVAAQVLFVLFMCACAKVPKEKIKNNMLTSADYLCERDVFFEIIEGITPTTIDRYADSITLNIAWNLNEDDAVASAMRDDFLTTFYFNENINLKASVTGEISNSHEISQYLRYWHGSAGIARFLHLFMSIKHIYILNAVIIVLLLGVLTFLFIRNKDYDIAIGFWIGMIATSSWFVPLSLEYTWVYIVMLAVTLAVYLLALKGKFTACSYVIFLGAMIVNFLDFLTAETLVLTVPLLVVIRVSSKAGKAVADGSGFVKKVFTGDTMRMILCAVSWVAGYALTWVSKWAISAVILHENIMPYVSEHISERLGGEVPGDSISSFGLLFGAIRRNVFSLFPIGYGAPGAVAAVIILIGMAYVAFVYRKKNPDIRQIIIYAVIGLIPYVRYLVLHNHSYIHRFFTCRAQMVTVMATVLIICELTGIGKDGKLFGKRKTK